MSGADVRMFMKRGRPVITRRWIRDWWRGYSRSDVSSALDKIVSSRLRPGHLIVLTDRERRALREIHMVEPGLYLVKGDR